MRILILFFIFCSSVFAATLAQVKQFDVIELYFTGPMQTANDTPTLDIDFYVDFQHMSGQVVRVHGYWDGDGVGGMEGDVFKVRFCPFLAGSWILANVVSNVPELKDQNEDDLIVVEESNHPGFWLLDEYAPSHRWFKRSNGEHQYIIGNTHYDFLSAPNGVPATSASIIADVEANAAYFKKLRFCVRGFRPENSDPNLKPFLSHGAMTDMETHQPNPKFFRERVDVAVKRGYELDLICDLILGGSEGDQVADSLGFLRYMAARYGAYPNVWFCVGQEFDEQTDAAHEVQIGAQMHNLTPFPNPVSTHGTAQMHWNSNLWGNWNSHSIRQAKLPQDCADMQACAQAMMDDYANNQGKPTLNDENGYDPGESSEIDVLEGILGTFAGGGYGTVGHKTADKQGAYFWGYASQGMNINEHPSADNLQWLRQQIDANMSYWRMLPRIENNICIMEWPQVEKAVFSNQQVSLTETLTDGPWRVVQFDVVNMSETVLSENAQGEFEFTTPASRSAITLFKNQNPVSVENKDQHPQKFCLRQNYPNPFNPATTIVYDLAKPTYVQLQIFNVRGQVIADLVDAQQMQGSYAVQFDGSQFASGLYFYQIILDNRERITKKMLLTK